MKAVFPLTLTLLSWTALQAASLSTGAEGVVYYDHQQGSTNTFNCSNTGTTTASCISPGEVSAMGTASYGAVGASFQSFDPPIPPGYTGVSLGGGAFASAQDSLTILGGTGSGTLKFYVYAIGSGTIQFGSFDLPCGAPDCLNFNDFAEIPFTFGTPIPLFLEASAGSGKFGQKNFFSGSTVLIQSFTIYDAERRVLPSYFISAESGATYQTFQTIPEPSTAILILAAGLGLAITRRRGRATLRAGSSTRTSNPD